MADALLAGEIMSDASKDRNDFDAAHKKAQDWNLYYELLYAVVRKFPNETRHETALRYIREAEAYCAGETSEQAKAQK